MRLARGVLLALGLVFALRPEILRYRPKLLDRLLYPDISAERRLAVGKQSLGYVLSHHGELEDPSAALRRIAELATSASDSLPDDPRPWILAGSARLVAGEPDLAAENYRRAFALGERAETDVNLARAYEGLGQSEKATAAYLRAVWISPALLPLLLPDVAAPLSAEIARLESELRAGRLKAPPRMPE